MLGGAEASVWRPARGTGPNARPRVRTRFPPTYLGPNLLAYIASLGDRRRPRRGPQEAPGRRHSSPRGPRRFRCDSPFPSCYLVRSDRLRSVLSSPLIGYYPCSQPERTSPLPGRHRPGPGGGRGCLGPITGLMVSPAGPEAVPAGSSIYSPVTGRIFQPRGWIVL